MDYINEIKDEKIKKALKKALARYSYKLRFCPASFSGRHHPKDERGKEGLLRHIEKICWFLTNACEVLSYPQWVKDIFIFSAYFHDLAKVDRAKVVQKILYLDSKRENQIEVSREIGIEGDKHPYESALLARKYLEREGVDQATIGVITNIILKHMSHWYENYPQPESEYERIFALADFIVSRKEFRIEKKGVWERLLLKLGRTLE